MRILWASNSPSVGSGYGVQSALFGPRLQALGHEVAFYANYGVAGGCITWDGMPIYPGDTSYGNRTLAAVAKHWNADIVIALCDAWVLDPDSWPGDFNIAVWAPVDHSPLPEPVNDVLKDSRVTPVAMSLFGERMMLNAGLEPLYVPHGVDTQVFQPSDRSVARDGLGLAQDAFVVGMVAANLGSPLLSRKAFPEAFRAFSRFRKLHRDAILYVHTNVNQHGDSGLPLRKLARACNIPDDRIIFTDALEWELGWPREHLAMAYSAFDVFLNASMGEGFGVPIVEAQACGVPVIVTDCTAMPELVGSGWSVEGDPWYSGVYDAWFSTPRAAEICWALRQAYDNAGWMGENARAFALQYDVDMVTEKYWVPALAQLDLPREVAPLKLAAAS